MVKVVDLVFEAIKERYIDDEDGEAKLVLKINMQDKFLAFAVPSKKRLKVRIEVINE